MNMTAILPKIKKIDEDEISSRIEVLEDGKIHYMKKGYGWQTTTKPMYSVKLELIFDESGLSQGEFGKKVGLTQPTISRMINGAISAKDNLVNIARAFNLNTEWLLCLDDSPQPRVNENILTFDRDDFVIVTRYAKGDNKGLNLDLYDTKNAIMLHTSILRNSNIDGLRFITQNDRSMSPDIHPGASVVFSLNNKAIVSGEMFVVSMADQISVRTIFTTPSGDLNLRAKMTDYPEYTISRDDPNIKILGRVLTVTNIY